MIYQVGVDLSVIISAVLSLEQVEVDILDLNFLEIKSDSCSPGGGALSKGVKLIHLRDIINQ
jgi:hypothetical protein